MEPTIIIDANTLSNRSYIEAMTKFFNMLKQQEVKMIFVSDGPLMDNRIGVWCVRRAEEFEEKKKILSDIDNSTRVSVFVNPTAVGLLFTTP